MKDLFTEMVAIPSSRPACLAAGLAVLLCLALVITPVLAQTTKKSARAAAPKDVFTDVTAKLGIHFVHAASPTSQKYLVETMGSGVALFDCDGDGKLDIFFVNSAHITDPMPKGALPVKDSARYWNRMYRQKNDGRFEDVTEKSGLQGADYGMGVAVGDYDNDGREDLYVTAFPHNRLYRNVGNCIFQDVTDESGTAGSGWSSSAAFVDIDNDGRLDLLVGRYLDWSFEVNPFCGEHLPGHRAYCSPDAFHGIPLLLFHNEGGGRFTEISQRAGLAKLDGKELGIALADVDHDGFTDIVVANDSIPEFLLHNKGEGTFEDIAVTAGVAVDENGRVYAGMGVDFADYDEDGFPDIIITNLSGQKYALYHNAGNKTFTYETGATGLGMVSRPFAGWGVKLMDYDNDGSKDLIIAQGHVLDTIQLTFPHLRYLQPPLLLHGDGKKFTDVSASSGEIFRRKWAARGLAVGDIDNDGLLDAVITTNNGPAYVLHNNSSREAHWLTLQLQGRASNRDGIGAEVRVQDKSGRSQYATVSTASSYLSANDRRLHFGLGSNSSASLIEIHWPSGIVQRLRDVPGNQILNITESDAAAKP